MWCLDASLPQLRLSIYFASSQQPVLNSLQILSEKSEARVSYPRTSFIVTTMEGKGGHCSNAIFLDDDDDGDHTQGFIDLIDLEDDDVPQSSGNIPSQRAQTVVGRAPVAQMVAPVAQAVAPIKSEPLTTTTTQRKPGQAKLESQAKAGAIAASIRKNLGELLRQRAEKTFIATPITPTTNRLTPQPPHQEQNSPIQQVHKAKPNLMSRTFTKDTVLSQREPQPKPGMMGQKLGFAALTDENWRREDLRPKLVSDSGEESSKTAIDTTHTAKPYACEKYKERYTERGGVTKHKKQHPNRDAEPLLIATTTERSSQTGLYSCEKCGKGYTRPDGVVRHNKRFPKCDVKPPTSTATTDSLPLAEQHACEKCGRIYRFRSGVNHHQRDHPDCELEPPSMSATTETLSETERYACEKCGRSYTKRKTLNRHKRDHPECDLEPPKVANETEVKATPKKAPPKEKFDSLAALPVFSPKRKRPIDLIPADMLFRPDQIVSKQTYDQAKRQRLEKKREKHEQALTDNKIEELETIIFDNFGGIGAAVDHFHGDEEQKTEAFGDDEADFMDHFQPNAAIDDEITPSEEHKMADNSPNLSNDIDHNTPLLSVMDQEPVTVGASPITKSVAVEVYNPKAAENVTFKSKEAASTTLYEPREMTLTKLSRAEDLAPPCKNEQQSGQKASIQSGEPAASTFSHGQHPRAVVARNGQDPEIASGEIDKLNSNRAAPRQKAGGKGISAATLAAWEAEEQEEIPNLTYHYYVCRRERATGHSDEDPIDATEQTLGPFHTMAEANAVASKEIHPSGDQVNGELAANGWSYSYQQDGDGLQTHTAKVSGVYVETVVYRGKPYHMVKFTSMATIDTLLELASTTRRVTLSNKAFHTPRHVFVVHELFWVNTPHNNTTSGDQTQANTTAHACFTILAMANKKAADVYLDAYWGNPPDNSKQGIEKAEMGMELRRELKELKEDEVGFDQEFEHEVGGWTRIWVTKMLVEGPRN
jgi:hypothetical protein